MKVLYHADCMDGYCAAYIAQLVNPLFTCIPVKYNEPPPDVTGEEVLIVDFSYKRSVLIEMHEKAKLLEVIDHHKTAEKELKGLPFCYFDMTKSGAMLTWEWFNPYKEAPQLIKYIQDRDLWKFELNASKKINAAIQSYDFTFENYQYLHIMLEEDSGFDTIRHEGEAILRYQEKSIRLHLDRAMRDGSNIAEVNISDISVISETLHRLAVGVPYSRSYYYDSVGKKIVSLRSSETGEDVSEIAKKFGGGGHKHAAGYSI